MWLASVATNRDSGVSAQPADDPPQTVYDCPQLRCSLMISPEHCFEMSPSLRIHLQDFAGARVCCGCHRGRHRWY